MNKFNVNSKSLLVAAIKKNILLGDADIALDVLVRNASPSDDVLLQAFYSRVALKIIETKKDLKIMKIVFLGTTTLNQWVDALRFWLLLEGFRLEPLIIPFGVWRQQILDDSSELYQFSPDIVWFFAQPSDLGLDDGKIAGLEPADPAVSMAIEDMLGLVSTLSENITVLPILNNLVPPAFGPLGNYEGTTPHSISSCIQKFNLELASKAPCGSVIFDIAHIACRFGLNRWHDYRLWHYSRHPFSFEVNSECAFAAAKLLLATRGESKKCLVLDLDNTIWGGVIGDDGLGGIRIGSDGGASGEAFAAFQTWLYALKERGIALAVCSKNNIETAQEPFKSKAGMVLKLTDFVSFKANWNNKADNIRDIARELNIGLDSFVFVDDNPAERELIRSELPEISVPELPADPSDFIACLASGFWFETVHVSLEDRQRIAAYQQNVVRTKFNAGHSNLHAFLKGLQMAPKWGEVSEHSIQRAVQLINKTNQFHLTTTRYTESQVRVMMNDPNYWVGWFALSDRFGDHGIISVVILSIANNVASVDTWCMSCRVFSRTMENFIFARVVEIAKSRGCVTIVGKHKLTEKNSVVNTLYSQLGGSKMNSDSNVSEKIWQFDINEAFSLDSEYIACNDS